MLQGLRPISKWKRFWKSDPPYDVISGAIPLFGGIAAGFRFLNATPPDKAAAGLAWGMAGVAFIVVLANAIKNHFANSGKDDDSPLEGLLHTIHSILQQAGKDPDPELRIALYVLDGKDPVQRTNYIGLSTVNGKGSRVSISSGVVGTAFRTGQIAHSKLPPNINIIDFLVSMQGFTREEAALRTSNRQSWIAVPVSEPGKTYAVIYCDSAERDYFGNAASQRRKVLTGAILGVAEFLRRRYK